MALAGSIESFPLGAVMSLLESTTARGVLRFSDGVDMELHVDRGVAVGWEPAVSDDPVALVARALATPGARFSWDDAAAPNGGRAPRALTILVAEAEKLAADWKEMREVAPSPAYRVVLDPEGDPGAMTLDAADWRTVCAAGAGPSLAEMASALSLPALETHRAVRRLVEGGLVRIEAPASAAGLPSVAAPAAAEAGAEVPGPGEPVLAVASEDDDPVVAVLEAAAAAADRDEHVATDEAGGVVVDAEDAPADELVALAATAVAAHTDEALDDRGPWPPDQLRDLVEAAHRETEAALAVAGAAAATLVPGPAPYDQAPFDHSPFDQAPAEITPSDAGVAPSPPVAPVPTAPVDRGSLLRFFTTARA